MKLAPLALALFLLPAAAMAQVKAAPQLQNHYVDHAKTCDIVDKACYVGTTFSVVFPDKKVEVKNYENDKFTLDTFFAQTASDFGGVLVITKKSGDITADDIAEAYAGMHDAYGLSVPLIGEGYVCDANQLPVSQGSFTCQTFAGTVDGVPDSTMSGFMVLRDKRTLVIAVAASSDANHIEEQAKFLESFTVLLPETM